MIVLRPAHSLLEQGRHLCERGYLNLLWLFPVEVNAACNRALNR